MLHPPSHRIDATPILVLEEDSAWDKPRIEAERKALKDAKHDPDRHPVAVYHSGETRYDLGATVRMPDGSEGKAIDYLNVGEAFQFVLKRIPWSSVYAIQQSVGASFMVGNSLACRLTLERVDGVGAPKIEHDKLGMVTDESMQALFDLRPSLPVSIGVAGFQASMPLSPAEKKH